MQEPEEEAKNRKKVIEEIAGSSEWLAIDASMILELVVGFGCQRVKRN